jgi:hypothetical protein
MPGETPGAATRAGSVTVHLSSRSVCTMLGAPCGARGTVRDPGDRLRCRVSYARVGQPLHHHPSPRLVVAQAQVAASVGIAQVTHVVG